MNINEANCSNCSFSEWLGLFHKVCDIVGEDYPDDEWAANFYRKGFNPKKAFDIFIEGDE